MTLETDLGPAAVAYRMELRDWLGTHAPAELRGVDIDDATPEQASCACARSRTRWLTWRGRSATAGCRIR